VEGMNVGGIILGYLAVLVIGVAALVGIGLLIARQTRAARRLFAVGLVSAAIIAALAILSFLAGVTGRPLFDNLLLSK
jgi:multisubunit Na+/H+ antiporter MnhC subunit